VIRKANNLLIAALAFACGAGLLIWAAVDAQWVQTVSVQDVVNNPAAYKSKSVRIYGCVASGSVKEEGQATEFELYWPRESQNPTQLLRISYTGLTKVNLTGGSDVLIDCKIDEQGRAVASRILTKCPSKYKSRDTKDQK
jgi:cytochrome c-type biogenesis protein CcmE